MNSWLTPRHVTPHIRHVTPTFKFYQVCRWKHKQKPHQHMKLKKMKHETNVIVTQWFQYDELTGCTWSPRWPSSPLVDHISVCQPPLELDTQTKEIMTMYANIKFSSIKSLRHIFTEIFWCATRFLNETVFQFGQVKVADYNFGVLQAVEIDKIFQLSWQDNCMCETIQTLQMHCWETLVQYEISGF